MVTIPRSRIKQFLDKSLSNSSSKEKGKALEDLVCYIFEKIPGIEITYRDKLVLFGSEEIDIAIWNNQHPKGFPFLPYTILIECKNWSGSVGNSEVLVFRDKLVNRGLTHGFLIAMNGISGNSDSITKAKYTIATALKDGKHIIVITKDDLAGIRNTGELISLIKYKLCELAVTGTTSS
jgi:hypothetical protein